MNSAAAVVLFNEHGEVLLVRENCVRFIFAGHAVGGELSLPATGEIADHAWFPTEGLPEHMTRTGPIGIQDAVSGRAGVLRRLAR